MTHLSRTTLINALLRYFPETPRVSLEAMSDEKLRIMFQHINNENSFKIRQMDYISI
ncbi:hypothetical protein RXV91_11010 [Lactiplantibacillus sp. DA1]|uniref:hypothetical protein n=1 Tax=Lactiplantibacillus sp. DA1 TaxID=3079857 RepID=UPI00292A65D9|nr:hypothetical protein [Lactiplantibacillus sp. DA1]MDV0431396.1 hypothetical protein [Lactiplantibacillus sp. DA1]